MRVNTLAKTKKKPDPYTSYYIMAFIFAIIFGYLLIFAFRIFVILGKLLIKYWYGGVIILLIILYFSRKRKRKYEKKTDK